MQLNISKSRSNFSEVKSLLPKLDLCLSDESINLKYISNDELLFRTENLVQTERKIMHLVLTYILEIMNRKLFADLGFDSMYSMMIKKYGYSETSALRRIDAAKLLRAVPEVADRLKSGTLNLSQAVQLQKCLELEAKKGEVVSESKTQEILDSLKNCNGFETRQVLAKEFDMPVKIQEVVRPQKDESVRLEMTFTKEQFEELKQAKSLLSHIAHGGSWADVISVLASKLNQSKLRAGTSTKSRFPSATEVKKSNSLNVSLVMPSEVEDSTINSQLAACTLLASTSKRRYLSVDLKRKIFARADGCCQYQTPGGSRCGSKFQVQIDHITPVSWGGSNSIDNLKLVCRTHNLLLARNMVLQ